MHDPRVHKYVAWDECGDVVGLSTLTSDLETVPWISAAYFAHLPRSTRRGGRSTTRASRWCTGGTGSRGSSRSSPNAWSSCSSPSGRCAYDICAYNNDVIGFAANIERLLHRNADVTVVPIDVQTYYSATFRGPRVRAEPVPGAVRWCSFSERR